MGVLHLQWTSTLRLENNTTGIGIFQIIGWKHRMQIECTWIAVSFAEFDFGWGFSGAVKRWGHLHSEWYCVTQLNDMYFSDRKWSLVFGVQNQTVIFSLRSNVFFANVLPSDLLSAIINVFGICIRRWWWVFISFIFIGSLYPYVCNSYAFLLVATFSAYVTCT